MKNKPRFFSITWAYLAAIFSVAAALQLTGLPWRLSRLV